MKDRTADNVHTAFIEEAKASQRLLLFAERAEEENLPQIAHLFRAIAAAESVHSRRHLALLEPVSDTQANREQTFQTEEAVSITHYSNMVKEAQEDREEAAATIFSQARDVEANHARLYKQALNHVIAQRSTQYYICNICGFVAERSLPNKCPVYNSPKSAFNRIS